MINDFLYAFVIGWLILFFFLLIILVFNFIRKPQESILIKKLVIYSSLVFAFGFGVLYILLNTDSF